METVHYENIPCRICEGRENKLLLKYNGYDIYKCKKCRLLFALPLPEKEELEDYYKKYLPNAEKRNYVDDYIKACEYSVIEKLTVCTSLASKRPETFLDVGCGCGFYLKGAEKFGLDCYGVEKDLEAVRFAKDFLGIEKIVNDIEQLNNLQNHFDIIHLRHVIEHISLPDNYLLKLNGLLKKDGILIIETPNSESWEHIPRLMPLEAMHRLKKTMPHCNALQRTAVSLTRPWRYVDPPRHLYGFNAYNLGLLLKKCNFQVKKTCKTMIGDKVYHPIPEKEKEDLRKAHKEAEIRLKKKSFFVYLTYQSIIKPLLDVFKLCIKFSKNGNNLSIYCQKINFSDHDW